MILKTIRRSLTTAVDLILRTAGYTGPLEPGAALLQWCATTAAGNARRILGTSTKVQLSLRVKTLTTVLYLSPSTESGLNLCPWSTFDCARDCLGHCTGHLAYRRNQITRIAKSLWWTLYPDHFLGQLDEELSAHRRRAQRAGLIPSVRLNGSSDIPWERTGIISAHPEIELYDYTKWPRDRRPDLPTNYHLIYSVSDRDGSMAEAREWITAQQTAAIVVGSTDYTRAGAKETARAIVRRGSLYGLPAISGDDHDARFLDPPGSLVILYAKGPLATRPTPFVHRPRVGASWTA